MSINKQFCIAGYKINIVCQFMTYPNQNHIGRYRFKVYRDPIDQGFWLFVPLWKSFFNYHVVIYK
jgi:hypothetical protein